MAMGSEVAAQGGFGFRCAASIAALGVSPTGVRLRLAAKREKLGAQFLSA